MILKDRNAIVFGGARGMGRAIALRFAREGCSVVIADILDADGEKTVMDIKASRHGRPLCPYRCYQQRAGKRRRRQGYREVKENPDNGKYRRHRPAAGAYQ